MPTVVLVEDPSVNASCAALSPIQQEVSKAYFAKREEEDVEEPDIINHTAVSGDYPSKIAKKYNVELSDVERTGTEDSLQIGENVIVNTTKKVGIKVKFTKLDTASVEDDVYIIVETLHLQEEEVLIKILQGEEDVLVKKDEAITVQQDETDVTEVKTKIGNYCEEEEITNKDDFIDWGIAKVKLQPKDEDKQKEWEEGLECVSTNKGRLYLFVDVHSENTLADCQPEYILYKGFTGGNSDSLIPNHFLNQSDTWFELKKKKGNSEYYIYKTGKIKLVIGANDVKDYYVEKEDDNFELLYSLTKNSDGMIKIPDSGDGFGKYGTTDAGGVSGGETVGQGDRYVLPKTAAALFGIISEVDDKGWTVDLGDMSSENGSDPWQSGFSHHAGHGHNGNRKGLDVDFRYINTSGVSYQGNNSSSTFDSDKNKTFFELAHKYGFRKNYCTNVSTVFGESVSGVSNVAEHIDHGHIGLSDEDIEEVDSVDVTVL